jgi:His/Glu/Gln/Arg/opine family amino acid ABC transporter permease subunit
MELLETFFNWSVFVDALPLMLRGLGVTVMLGVVSIILGLVGGLVLAMLRLYGYAPVRFLARVYIDVLRSIPLLVLLVLIYYALPFVGIRLSSFAAATAALSLVSCAYSAEIFPGHEFFQHYARHHPAPGHAHRHAADDQQLHQRHERHRAGVGRGDARSSVWWSTWPGRSQNCVPPDFYRAFLCLYPKPWPSCVPPSSNIRNA